MEHDRLSGCRDCPGPRVVHQHYAVGGREALAREYEALAREYDRLMNERARLILDGVDPVVLALPISPMRE